MNLKQIAMDALDEYENGTEGEVPKGVEKKDNGDGTVDLSFSFTLDPKVVAQKAKAMAKGVKRDDMTDDLGVDTDGDDDVEEVFSDDVEDGMELIKKERFHHNEEEGGEGADDGEDDEDPFNGVSTEDSATDTVFMDALDSIAGVDTEDARQNSRHSQTPLENCRAKDPRFCPYHGEKAWTSQLENELQNRGIVGGKVSVKNDNGRYEVSVRVPTADMKAATDMIDGILNTKGVEHAASGFRSEAFYGNGEGSEGAKFKVDQWSDRTGRLNEWVDDYMADVASDPNADIDMDDFNSLLEAQEDIDAFEAKMDRNDANDMAKYNAMVDAAEKTYHTLMAQQYMKDVTDDQKATDKMADLSKEYKDIFDKAHGRKDYVDLAKQKLFGGSGAFPRGFSKQNAFADEYNKASQRLFYWADREFTDALTEYHSATDLKGKRTALAAMDYRKDNFEQGVPKYEAAADKFLKDLYNWANNDPTYQGKLAAAFPNGRP